MFTWNDYFINAFNNRSKGDACLTFIEKCLSPFPPFSVFRLFGSEKDSKSMSDLFLPDEVKSAADSVIGDDNPDDGSCFSGVKT